MATAKFPDNSTKRRRWIIGVAVFLVLAVLLAASNHYKNNYYGEVAFPTPKSSTGFSTNLTNKEFKKPEGIKIIALVFFGRKNRVEMLKCYLEVGLLLTLMSVLADTS